jgi:hypothetical protein
VIHHGHTLEDPTGLERPGHPERGDLVGREVNDGGPPEAHLAAGRGEETAQAIEHGRLTGPVGADQPNDLPLSHPEIDLLERRQAAEIHADGPHLEKIAHHATPPCGVASGAFFLIGE